MHSRLIIALLASPVKESVMAQRGVWKRVVTAAALFGMVVPLAACGSDKAENSTEADGKPVIKMMITR